MPNWLMASVSGALFLILLGCDTARQEKVTPAADVIAADRNGNGLLDPYEDE